MFKKLLFSLSVVMVGAAATAQTIVNTDPENKKVILEEFTGINCVFCPQGHTIAQGIQDNNPGNVFLINVHVGGFATPNAGQPDFRTPFGSALASQSNLAGYPAGTVNRHEFPGLQQNGTGTAMGRGNWAQAANQVLGESSYVNVGVEADLDVQSRELTVHVEVYYTGDSPQSTNKLNIALLQNNTLGPQTGGNMGDEYVHMHRLVHFLTGQWGEDITTTTNGSFIDETYTYTIPEDYNDIPVNLGNLELVAYVAEGQQEVISGNGAYPTLINFEFQDDAALANVSEILDQCATSITPEVTIANNGENNLTSVDIEYSINGGTAQNYSWTGDLSSFETETVELPEISYTLQASNTLTITFSSDDNSANNTSDIAFDEAVESISSLSLEVNTDNWGEECTWELLASDGSVIADGGPYADNQTFNIEIEAPEDCYQFNLYDSYGDGGGAVTLEDGEGLVIYQTNGSYGSGETRNFSTNGVLGLGDNTLTGVSIYPNPANTVLNIRNAEDATIQVYDVLGKVIFTKSNIGMEETLDVASFQTGTYFVKVSTNAGSTVEQIVIAR
ncbi:Omp28-related outer membrane protein [Flavobacteriaceae bacterium TK19130]|nr:Omp28-related outer membrane protein [Thermobacterium salinum]